MVSSDPYEGDGMGAAEPRPTVLRDPQFVGGG